MLLLVTPVCLPFTFAIHTFVLNMHRKDIHINIATFNLFLFLLYVIYTIVIIEFINIKVFTNIYK